MSTFDPSTATVVVNSAQGVSTMRPPFTSPDQITNYMTGLQSVSALKKKGMLTLEVLTPTANISSSSIATGTELPAVQVYNIPKNNPPIFAVVYTDINGNSSFSYKNDPNNLIQLVQNGSQILPTQVASVQGNSGTQGTSGSQLVCDYCGKGGTGRVDPGCPAQSMACAANQNYDAGAEGGGILGGICWCLSCMSCIGILILCVLLFLKQSSVPQPST